jgi:hypothetical protein
MHKSGYDRPPIKAKDTSAPAKVIRAGKKGK